MPAGRDLAFEATESGKLALVDTCTLRVWTWLADAGGGRILNSQTDYTGLPCRLVAVGFPDEREDEAGVWLRAPYELWMAVGNSVPEDYLKGKADYYVEVEVTAMRGVAISRVFFLVGYGASSQQALRRLYVLEDALI